MLPSCVFRHFSFMIQFSWAVFLSLFANKIFYMPSADSYFKKRSLKRHPLYGFRASFFMKLTEVALSSYYSAKNPQFQIKGISLNSNKVLEKSNNFQIPRKKIDSLYEHDSGFLYWLTKAVSFQYELCAHIVKISFLKIMT